MVYSLQVLLFMSWLLATVSASTNYSSGHPWSQYMNNFAATSQSSFAGLGQKLQLGQTQEIWSSIYPNDNWSYGINKSPVVSKNGDVYIISRTNGDFSRTICYSRNRRLKWYFDHYVYFPSMGALDEDGNFHVCANSKLMTFSPSGAVIRTIMPLSCGAGSVVVGPNKQLFIASYDKKIYSINPTKGAAEAINWIYNVGETVSSTPSMSGTGSIYFGSQEGSLFSLNATSGVLLWRRTVVLPVVFTPIVHEANLSIYFLCDFILHKIDMQGHFVWNSSIPSSSHIYQPALGGNSSHPSVVVSTYDKLISVNITDGAFEWTADVFVGYGFIVDAAGYIYLSSLVNLDVFSPRGKLSGKFGAYSADLPALGFDGELYYTDKYRIRKFSTVCNGGEFLNRDWNRCEACPVGKYGYGSTNIYASNEGCTSVCPAGSYSDVVSRQCQYCGGGTITATAGLTSCSICGMNTYAGFNASTCISCGFGTMSYPGSSYCSNCFGHKGDFACPCKRGYTVDYGGRKCVPCSPGLLEGNGSCYLCPKGLKSAKGSTMCQEHCPRTTSVQMYQYRFWRDGTFDQSVPGCEQCPYPSISSVLDSTECSGVCVCLEVKFVATITSVLGFLVMVSIAMGKQRFVLVYLLLTPTIDFLTDVAYVVSTPFYHPALFATGVIFILLSSWTFFADLWERKLALPTLLWSLDEALWLRMTDSRDLPKGDVVPVPGYRASRLTGTFSVHENILFFIWDIFVMWPVAAMLQLGTLVSWLIFSVCTVFFFVAWMVLGVVLHLTKSLCIKAVWNMWFGVWTRWDPLHQTDVDIDTDLLNSGLYSEFVFESLPQCLLQINNSLFGVWTPFTAFSAAVSFAMTINGLYRFSYYRFLASNPTAMKDIPVEINWELQYNGVGLPLIKIVVPPASKKDSGGGGGGDGKIPVKMDVSKIKMHSVVPL